MPTANLKTRIHANYTKFLEIILAFISAKKLVVDFTYDTNQN